MPILPFQAGSPADNPVSLRHRTARQRIADWWRRVNDHPLEFDLRPYYAEVERIRTLSLAPWSDGDIAAAAARLRARACSGVDPLELRAECFALAAAACRRSLGLEPFDEQLLAGIALSRGRLVQLPTGEGKTLAAVFAAALHALGGRGVHVLTANDYLARRDAAWMGPIYNALGLRVAAVWQGMTPTRRRLAYRADVTYVTAREAGFDFLRDRTALHPRELVQRPFHWALVDEADLLLIDEARVPLVLAGSDDRPPPDHRRLAALVRRLEAERDYRVDPDGRTLQLGETGLERCERELAVDFGHPDNLPLLAALNVALHAEVLLRRDRDYIVRDGRVELIDAFTGRVAELRRYPHGIQPAVEAKEGVEVHADGRILGSIAVQFYIRRYPHLAGMTATAEAAALELREYYGLTTVVVPPHRPSIRRDFPDRIYATRAAKEEAVVAEILHRRRRGQPVLVGTADVAESERLAARLRCDGIACRVLNARHDRQEAELVARAGEIGAVTVATNMAGRGTDIVPGGSDPATRQEVLARGGLLVLGTHRHETIRIDQQLRGRSGRQGDPGESVFFVSLEDEPLCRYPLERILPARFRPTGDRQVPPGARKYIDHLQRRVEGENTAVRRTMLQYTGVVEEQRRGVDEWRRNWLHGADLDELDEGDTGSCHRRELNRRFGEAAVDAARRRLALRLLDRAWSDHLAALEDLREGIHLQRYAGRLPLEEFRRQAMQAFADFHDDLRREISAAFLRLGETGGLDVESLAPPAPAATWTYMVGDDPFSSTGLNLLGSRMIGFAVGAAMDILLSLALLPLLKWRRRRQAKAGSESG